jgi:zinc D-Ala-D-Ala carboxypeptidase
VNLTEHFQLQEFEHEGPMPAECVAVYTVLCQQVLEPARAYFSEPIIITSGYRSVAVNNLDHGMKNSEHIATKDWCAADLYIDKFRDNMRPVFDRVRESELPFHQVILEHGAHDDIIHVSWNRLANARQAFEGSMNNASPYIAWPVGQAIGVEINA